MDLKPRKDRAKCKGTRCHQRGTCRRFLQKEFSDEKTDLQAWISPEYADGYCPNYIDVEQVRT